MRKFVIVSDSCCDLDAPTRKKYEVDYIPMRLLYDGNDIPADLDWGTLSSKQFYDMMRSGTRFRTAQINAEKFREVFLGYLSNDCDVLYIACSSALSSSWSNSLQARDALLKEFPGTKIVCIDSRNACMGLGILCMTASDMRAAGSSIDEVAAYIEEHKQEVNQFATVESLSYLKRAGRVSTTSAVFGGLMQVKPIIISDTHGQNVAVEKVMGRKKTVARLAELFKDAFRDNEYQYVYVMHADCPEGAEELKALVEANLAGRDIPVRTAGIGPIIGATTGPGTLAVYCRGKEVTFCNSRA